MAVRRKPKPLLYILAVIIIIVSLLMILKYLMSPVDKSDTKNIEFEVKSGETTTQIAKNLKSKDLIKSEMFFRIYLKIYNKNTLKASTYTLNKSMNLEEIIKNLEDGNNYNPNRIVLTFKEGKRVTDYAALISENTNHTYEDVISVMTNRKYIKTLIPKYWFLSENILDDRIYYPLEGYLFPDTYYFDNKDIEIEKIIETLLNEMSKKLENYKNLTPEEINRCIILASIAELEGNTEEDRKEIVGVFNNRISIGMNLGSDVTTYYGLQLSMKEDLTAAQIAEVNDYNTRTNALIGQLPIGAVSNPGMASIEAGINPNTNDYLFFVADKYGKIYFSKNEKEHYKKIEEIKNKGDWIW